jgi:hypothetical protein
LDLAEICLTIIPIIREWILRFSREGKAAPLSDARERDNKQKTQ